MIEGAHDAPGRLRTPSPQQISRRRLLLVGGSVVGGAAVGATLTGAWSKIGGAEAARMDPIPTAFVPQVRGTLVPEQAAWLVEEASRCRQPLAHVTVWHSPDTRGGAVSIVSGSYQSPRFTLTAAPSLIAVPYPAPYLTGRGVLTLIGEANNIIVALTPRRNIIDFKGSLPIPVWWIPVEGCP
jgi:hypothetical protein